MGKIWSAFRTTPAWDVYKGLAALPDYYYWRLRGSPMRRVPHLLKQRTVREYARRYEMRTMIETGTNMGQMIGAMLPLMGEIYSIEMDDASYQRAQGRFAKNPKVHMIHGNSAIELARLLENIHQPSLFWLDAHNFEWETPVREELQAIADHFVPGHIILLDDSKWFDGRNQYPTMEWMQDFVQRRFPGYTLRDAMHMLRITPD